LGALVAAFALSPAMAYAGFVIMGLGASVIAPTAFSMVGQAARPEARARAVARATFLGYLGYFFGPPTLGFLAAAFGLRAAFAFAALALLSVLVLAPLMARRG
ncbi:MFS transporter, partial [Cereibacter johrii]